MQKMKSITEIMAVTVLMLVSAALYAQDKIYFNDAAPENADVREIGDDYVLYKQWGSPDGPDYRASLSRVNKIVFRDGTERVFDGQILFGREAAMPSPVIPGFITYRRGRFYDGPYMLSTGQIMDYIGYTNYGSVYMKAKRQYMAGTYLVSSGAGFLFAGLMITVASAGFDGDMGSDAAIYGVCYALGAAGLAAGIPLLVTGNRKLGALADNYNSRHGYGMRPGSRPAVLSLGCCNNGVGLAFNF